MGNVIGESNRDKPAKGLSFLLKYSDLEACLADCVSEDIYLRANFRHEHSTKRFRDRLKDAGRFHIVGCSYHPDGTVMGWRPPENVKNPIVISAWVTSLPAKIVAENHISRAKTRNILCEKISKQTQIGFTRAAWYFRLTLLAKSCEIECATGFGSAYYYDEGLIDSIEIISLDPEKDPPDAD